MPDPGRRATRVAVLLSLITMFAGLGFSAEQSPKGTAQKLLRSMESMLSAQKLDTWVRQLLLTGMEEVEAILMPLCR